MNQPTATSQRHIYIPYSPNCTVTHAHVESGACTRDGVHSTSPVGVFSIHSFRGFFVRGRTQSASTTLLLPSFLLTLHWPSSLFSRRRICATRRQCTPIPLFLQSVAADTDADAATDEPFEIAEFSPMRRSGGR